MPNPMIFSHHDIQKLFSLAFMANRLFKKIRHSNYQVTEKDEGIYREIQIQAQSLQHIILIRKEINPKINNLYHEYAAILILDILCGEYLDKSAQEEALFYEIVQLFSNWVTVQSRNIKLLPNVGFERNIKRAQEEGLALVKDYLNELFNLWENMKSYDMDYTTNTETLSSLQENRVSFCP